MNSPDPPEEILLPSGLNATLDTAPMCPLSVTISCPFSASHNFSSRSAAERAIRLLAVGRANWLHVGGDSGLKTASVVLSVCASAKRLQLNPWLYLRDVLDRLASRSGDGDMNDLLPDGWASRHNRAG